MICAVILAKTEHYIIVLRRPSTDDDPLCLLHSLAIDVLEYFDLPVTCPLLTRFLQWNPTTSPVH